MKASLVTTGGCATAGAATKQSVAMRTDTRNMLRSQPGPASGHSTRFGSDGRYSAAAEAESQKEFNRWKSILKPQS